MALLPGSRPNELERIAPTMAAALPLIRARVPDVQFVVACAPNLAERLFAPLMSRRGRSRPVLVHGRTDDVLAASDVVDHRLRHRDRAGALHERPMVVVYRLSPLTYRLGKPFVNVDTYAMPNLVAGRRIVPELIQDEFTPRARGGRDRRAADGSATPRAHARGAAAVSRAARRAGRERPRRRGGPRRSPRGAKSA